MKTVIASDSFKGSLTSYEVGVAICKGILAAAPGADVIVREVADGGEGTSGIVTRACGGEIQYVSVPGPLPDQTVQASYGIIDDGKTAVIDISQAAGLTLVPGDKRDPLYTTTRGVGELILDALDKGCRKFIIGLGGSATNDCGAGMLQALGIRLTDKDGRDIRPGAVGLSELESIDDSALNPRIRESEFLVACDVKNPLTGSNGCSFVYAPQKGADEGSCELMDGWISSFAKKAGKDGDFEGAGAAGGLGFAFAAVLSGKLVSGAELVISHTHLEECMEGADIVITGEGKVDRQTAMGKIPAVIAGLAGKHGCRVIVFAGKVECDEETLSRCGIDEVYSISEGISEEESVARAAELLTVKAKEVFDGRSV